MSIMSGKNLGGMMKKYVQDVEGYGFNGRIRIYREYLDIDLCKILNANSPIVSKRDVR